jgi:hypothetical protein
LECSPLLLLLTSIPAVYSLTNGRVKILQCFLFGFVILRNIDRARFIGHQVNKVIILVTKTIRNIVRPIIQRHRLDPFHQAGKLLATSELIPGGAKIPKGVYERKTENPIFRFWSKVDKNGPLFKGIPCWNWTDSLRSGYGTFYVSGARNAQQRIAAHRYAYELLVWPIGPDLELDHLCRNRRCVNPAHLEEVPHRINVLRGTGISAQRAGQTHCKNGHEMTPANTIWLPSGTRRCRACLLVFRANHREKKNARLREIRRLARERSDPSDPLAP